MHQAARKYAKLLRYRVLGTVLDSGSRYVNGRSRVRDALELAALLGNLAICVNTASSKELEEVLSLAFDPD